MTYGELRPGDTFRHAATGRTLTVLSVEPTGTVKFGEVGPNATPIIRVTVDGMPRPLVGRIEVAADQTLDAVSRHD